jgi:RNA polymerase sigma-70 factor, ECF subfamily
MMDVQETEQLSDEEIVKLSLTNEDYFLYLIGRYQTKLFNYVRRLTNISAAEIEDLLQEVFLKIYLNLNDFDTSLKFSSWVYAITRNQVISNHRKLHARAEGHKVSLEDDDVKEIATDFDIKSDIDQKFLRENIDKVLDKLNAKHREVLILKFLEEKNYQEISDIIKRPIGTVGSLLNKAKQEFKKEFIKQNIKT